MIELRGMPRKVLSAAARPFRALFDSDALAGILLITVAVLAILAANSPLAGAYHGLFHAPLAWTPVAKLDTLHLWINDGLMAVFFFVVGLEVKREMVAGNLADAQSCRLPMLAAAARMAVPALIYLAIAGAEPQLHRGWAIMCGVGFTMSLFIGALAFPRDPALVEQAKLGVIAGSLVSALLGYAVLRLARPRKD